MLQALMDEINEHIANHLRASMVRTICWSIHVFNKLYVTVFVKLCTEVPPIYPYLKKHF